MRSRAHLTGTALAVAAAAVLTSACGTGSAPPASSAATSSAAAASYATCLRQHGVTLPQFDRSANPRSPRPSASPRPSDRPRPSGSPRPGGFGFGSQAPPGVDQSTWDKAMQACASLRPTGNPFGNRDNGAIAAYRNCLSEHGVTLTGPINTMPSSDPKVAAALSACAVLRPSTRPSPTPSG